MSCSDSDWTQTQRSNESSQDLLDSINGSQIRHGPHRRALVERKNELDIEPPGAKSGKESRKRVNQKIQDGVPMSTSGSGFGESVAVGVSESVNR